jgi:hypothetical protein
MVVIISWDVGVINLAFCIIMQRVINGEYIDKIMDWGIINLIEDERINLTCCGKMKNGNVCGKKASRVQSTPKKSYGFCKMHLSQATKYWSNTKTRRLFKMIENSSDCVCDYTMRSGSKCKSKAKFCDLHGKKYCTAHHKTTLNKLLKEYSPQIIRNTIVKKISTLQLQLTLINKLDQMINTFIMYDVTEVVIENQPANLNPKMKAIAGTLQNYFLLRGIKDHTKDFMLDNVCFMNACNKLKVNEKNTIENFRGNVDGKKYKITKALGVKYTKQLLKKDDDDGMWAAYLATFKKQDDLCDCYLQAKYYLYYKRDPKLAKKKKSEQKQILNDDIVNSENAKIKSKKAKRKAGSKRRSKKSGRGVGKNCIIL